MNALLSRLQAALAGRYAVEHELGRGGMAVVYLGHDLRLERRVAIKVFEREGAGAEGSERFLREIGIAAQLQHPNILPVFESGEAEGLVYYVMPYVAGASLRERLEREGPLPIPEAVRIGREVALALDHAHAAGIVHRDIKPDNIMLSGGVAVVADFGIARAVEQAGGGTLTGTGMAIGTPVYMSPEQATAAPQIDGRADIYALGCVLYEMLAGSPPFHGPTAQAVMARHSVDTVPPLRTVRPEVPTALETVVVKALAKLPVDRWGSGREFAEALEKVGHAGTGARGHGATLVRVGVAAAGVAIAAAGAWIATGRAGARGSGEADSLRSVAVLPFTMIGDTAQDYVALGLTEAVITALVKIEGLRVPSFSSVTTHLGDDAEAVGRRLNVATVLTGSIQVVGHELRVAPRLVRVSDGVNIWAELYNGEMIDIFAMQDSIAEKIVAALQIRLAPAAQAALARGVRTRDTEAYELYLRGRRATYELTRPGVERGIALLEQALQRDSTFADAWVALADAYGFYAQFGGLPPAEVTSRYRKAVERGIELDSLNGYAYALRAQLRLLYDWDHEGALRDLRRAERLSPGSADVQANFAVLLNLFNEPDSSLAHMRRAVELDPLNPFMWMSLGIRFGYLGWADSARAAHERAVALDSTNWLARLGLADAHRAGGRHDAAEREVDAALRLSGDSLPLALALVARQPGRAREMLDRLTVLSRRQHVQAIYLAMARVAAGDRAGALDAIEVSARDHDLDLLWFLDDLKPLHGDPRYEAVRRRVYGERLNALRQQQAAARTPS